MVGQPGLRSDERYRALAKLGDPLIRLAELIEFEVFRSQLLTALARSDGSRGGRPPYDPVLMFKILLLQTASTPIRLAPSPISCPELESPSGQPSRGCLAAEGRDRHPGLRKHPVRAAGGAGAIRAGDRRHPDHDGQIEGPRSARVAGRRPRALAARSAPRSEPAKSHDRPLYTLSDDAAEFQIKDRL